jgi:hypothetical protein
VGYSVAHHGLVDMFVRTVVKRGVNRG